MAKAQPVLEEEVQLRLWGFDELVITPPQWVAPGWIARQEVNIVVGNEGIGKSQFWGIIAAAVTSGQGYPAMNLPPGDPQYVVLVVTEDSSSIIKDRLTLAGADLDYVKFFCSENDGSGTPTFGSSFTGDMVRLDGNLGELDGPIALVVVDAWLDTVQQNVNIRDTQQARANLHPWKQLAQKNDTAVILMTHSNRLQTTNTRDLMGGSAALRQKARMVLFAAQPEGDGEHVWIGPDKANTTGLANALKFTLNVVQVRKPTPHDPGTSSHLTEPEDAGDTISALIREWSMNSQHQGEPPKATQAELCERFVVEYCEDHVGDIYKADLKAFLTGKVADGHKGFGIKAAERAMSNLGSSRPSGMGGPHIYTLDAIGQVVHADFTGVRYEAYKRPTTKESK